MKKLITTGIFSLIASLIVYFTIYKITYQELINHQAETGHIPYSPDVPVSTPADAWIEALPPAALSFLIFFGLIIYLRGGGRWKGR